MTKSLFHTALALVCAGGAFWANGAVADKITPLVADAPVGMTAQQQERVDKIASASLFGQFRASMSDFLWLKVDKYLHNGVDLRGTTEAEQKRGADAVSSASSDGNRAHHVGEETTVVPSAARDWRGPFGSVERDVQPYKDMANHTHRDPKEALPLFRLMTLSNPHFIPGYTTGAAMIARDKTKFAEAQAFLEEGQKNNPSSIEIAEGLGSLLTLRKRDFGAALPHLLRAVALGEARDAQSLSDDEREAYQNAFRTLVLNRREVGDNPAALAAAKQGLALFPDDPVCRHYLEAVRGKPTPR